MKILIADDEKLARQRLRSLLDELSDDTEIVAEARIIATAIVFNQFMRIPFMPIIEVVLCMRRANLL